jgi:hypothetical protein
MKSGKRRNRTREEPSSVNPARHQRCCTVCRHADRKLIEHEFPQWRSPGCTAETLMPQVIESTAQKKAFYSIHDSSRKQSKSLKTRPGLFFYAIQKHGFFARPPLHTRRVQRVSALALQNGRADGGGDRLRSIDAADMREPAGTNANR